MSGSPRPDYTQIMNSEARTDVEPATGLLQAALDSAPTLGDFGQTIHKSGHNSVTVRCPAQHRLHQSMHWSMHFAPQSFAADLLCLMISSSVRGLQEERWQAKVKPNNRHNDQFSLHKYVMVNHEILQLPLCHTTMWVILGPT